MGRGLIKNYCNGLSMLTPFSIEKANNATFISELVDFIPVVATYVRTYVHTYI